MVRMWDVVHFPKGTPCWWTRNLGRYANTVESQNVNFGGVHSSVFCSCVKKRDFKFHLQIFIPLNSMVENQEEKLEVSLICD